MLHPSSFILHPFEKETLVINMNLSPASRWGINAAILLSMVLALYLGSSVFIPLIISLLLAAMLWPTATWMHHSGIPIPWLKRREGFPWVQLRIVRPRIPWSLACLSVVAGLVTLILLLGLAFGLGISKIVIDLGTPEKQVELYHNLRSKLKQLPIPLEEEEYFPPQAEKSKVLKSFQSSLNPETSPAFVNLLMKMAGYGGSFLWQSVLIMFILLFLLLEGRMLTRRVVEIFGPSPAVQGKAVEALKDMASQLRAYLVWRTIINFVMAGVLGVVYYFAGLQLPWTWMLLTALLWYIPYIGPIIAGVPPVLDAFISCDSAWVAIGILLFYTFFVVIEGYVVVPVVMGRSMEMNATTVLLACIFWELVWGAPGLFLAMPLMAAVKSVCTHVDGWQPWANLMSSHEELPTTTEEKLHPSLLPESRESETQKLTAHN